MKTNHFTIVIFFCFGSFVNSQNILHVPAQYPTIRTAVNASVNGDTVLVDPGIYYENDIILIENKGITIRSSNGADTTTIIIESIYQLFELRFAENTYIEGFTIQLNALPIQSGGAFFIYATDNLLIENVIIEGSQDGTAGCAVYIDDASPHFYKILIHHNATTHPVGGVIRVEGQTSYPKFENCTIVNNVSTQRGMITLQGGNIEIKNSILWNNSYPLIYFNGGAVAQSSASVSYSDFEGGLSSIVINNNGTVNWGSGNIDSNPLFINPADTNYYLQSNSPCIDAGDPTSPYDPDGTITDMGAFHYDQTIPVELISFTADLIGGSIMLLWATATETNNSGFEIQRKLDNSDWERIGFVEGHGTTTDIQKYSYKDIISNNNANSIAYRLRQIDYDGSYKYSDKILVNIATPTKFVLKQNYPNPFNPSTKIEYQIPEMSFVSLKVYNVLGKEIAMLVNEEKPVGSYEIEFNGEGLPSGVYFYQIRSGDFVETKKMIFIK